MKVLRGMKIGDDDLPKTGASARTLGARAVEDIPVDENGFVRPGDKGRSVAPHPPDNIIYFRRPPEHGGTGRDPLWELETDELPEELEYRPDPENPDGHGLIGPSRQMTFEEYQQALHATRSRWSIL